MPARANRDAAASAAIREAEPSDRVVRGVLLQVRKALLDEFKGSHRIAILERIYSSATPFFETTLRHELEHARQWEECGPEWASLDQDLHDRVGEGSDYFLIPSERAANAAAAAFVEAREPGSLARVAADSRFSHYGNLGSSPGFDELADLTAEALRSRLDPDTGGPSFDKIDQALAHVEKWRSEPRVTLKEVPTARRIVLV